MLRRSSAFLLLQISMLWLAKQTSAQSTSTDSSTDSTTVSTQLCDPGYYMATYGCSWCPSGAYCPGNTYNPIPCPRGTNTNWGAGQSQCTPCMSGTYASVPGTEYCQTCPSGYSCADPAYGPVACPLGTSTQGMSNMVNCMPCYQGSIANKTGSDYCSDCPDGFYCPNATIAIPCPIGMASRVSYNYGRDSTTCVACPVGTYAPSTGSPVCQSCPDGNYCPDPTLPPVQCPKGTSSHVDNNMGYNWNFNNYYYYVWFDSYNQKYWANSYQYSAGERCYPCPLGYYADVTGLRDCKRCPDGFMCPDKKAAPSACPIGFYSSYYNQYSISNIGDTCMRCPPGTYTNSSGSTYCQQCNMNMGMFNSMLCQDPASPPSAPPPGFMVSYTQYWTGYEYLYQANVYRCSKGQYVTNDTMGNYYCNMCPPGYYCPDSSLPPQLCPSGLISQSWGAWTCGDCGQGYYVKNGKCQVCPPGYSCPYSSQDPIPCPRGSYSFIGQSYCTKCPYGTYNTGVGSLGCVSCPDGCCCSDPSKDPVCSS